MSRKPDGGSLADKTRASVFSALGDGTRLHLIGKLSVGSSRSISELTADTRLTRQAVTKHLRILEEVGLVSGARRGREIQFTFTPAPVAEAMAFLEKVSEQWDQALGRLKALVEDVPGADPR